MTCCFFVIHIKRKNRFSKMTLLTISAVNFNRKEPLDFQTVRGQLEHTLITPVRWLHYSTEGESPGLRSPLLHILSWAITSSQGGLNTALSMSATITQTENIWQAINTAENTCFCPLFDPFIHVPEEGLCFCCHTTWRRYIKNTEDLGIVYERSVHMGEWKISHVWSSCHWLIFILHTGAAVYVSSLPQFWSESQKQTPQTAAVG